MYTNTLAYQTGLLLAMVKRADELDSQVPQVVRPERSFLETPFRLGAAVGGGHLGDVLLKDKLNVPRDYHQRAMELLNRAHESSGKGFAAAHKPGMNAADLYLRFKARELGQKGRIMRLLRNKRLAAGAGRWGIGAALASMLAGGLLG